MMYDLYDKNRSISQSKTGKGNRQLSFLDQLDPLNNQQVVSSHVLSLEIQIRSLSSFLLSSVIKDWACSHTLAWVMAVTCAMSDPSVSQAKFD